MYFTLIPKKCKPRARYDTSGIQQDEAKIVPHNSFELAFNIKLRYNKAGNE